MADERRGIPNRRPGIQNRCEPMTCSSSEHRHEPRIEDTFYICSFVNSFQVI